VCACYSYWLCFLRASCVLVPLLLPSRVRPPSSPPSSSSRCRPRAPFVCCFFVCPTAQPRSQPKPTNHHTHTHETKNTSSKLAHHANQTQAQATTFEADRSQQPITNQATSTYNHRPNIEPKLTQQTNPKPKHQVNQQRMFTSNRLNPASTNKVPRASQPSAPKPTAERRTTQSQQRSDKNEQQSMRQSAYDWQPSNRRHMAQCTCVAAKRQASGK
jgi:hypothetical protein